MAKCLINNTGNKGANGVMIQILNFFVSRGYTPTQACAVAGNISKESGGYNPNAVEKGSGEGIGLCQWSFTRKTALKEYTKNMPGGWQSVENQLKYLGHELDTTYKPVDDYFKGHQKNTIKHYTDYWCDEFEVPDPKKADKPGRLAEANKAAAVYNQMNKGECVVDTSGSSSGSGGFSCEPSDEPTDEISIVTESTASVTTAQSNGDAQSNGNAKNQTVDTRPLFVGDSWAVKIYGNTPEMKKNWQKLAVDGQYMQYIAKQLKERLSNPLCKPRYIVIYCGDDTKMKNNTSGMFINAVDPVKDLCRKILGSANGVKVYFCENIMGSIYIHSCSDYYWTAASVINRSLRKIESEGDSSRFTILTIDKDLCYRLNGYKDCHVDKRTTLKPKGFAMLGTYIYNKVVNS